MTAFDEDPDYQDGHARFEQLLRGAAERELDGDMLDALWRAAARGNPLAYADLGDLYLAARARGGVVDARLGDRPWTDAARAVVDAPLDAQAALRCFHTAATLGDRTAAVRFAWIARHASKHNLPPALELLRALPEPTPRELHELGLVHHALGQLEDSARAQLAAAERGDRDAMFELWLHHGQGLGVPVDLAAATRWLAAAADAGHPRALYNVGAGHAQGLWGPADLAKAAAYYERAAHAGSARAAATLAIMLLTGQLVGTTAQATSWLDRADELGASTHALLAEAGLADPRAAAPR